MDYTTETPAVDDNPLRLDPLKLPSGGFVAFNDPEDLTGKDVRLLRKALDAPGQGSATNQFYEAAMRLLVASWEIPYAPSLQLPQYDKSQKAEVIGRLRARDLRAIERHLSPVLREITRGGEEDEDAEGGSPS